MQDISATWRDLSPAQLDIWVNQQVQPNKAAYNMAWFTRIEGAFDEDLFTQALEQATKENDALRTVLDESDFPPRQAFPPDKKPELSLIHLDTPSTPLEERDQQAWARMRELKARPLGRDGGLFVSHALIRVAPDLHYWCAVYSHIVIDGWGISLVSRRVAEIYSALEKKSTPTGNPYYPPAEFLAPSQNIDPAAAREFWKSHFSPTPPPLFPRPKAEDPGDTTPSMAWRDMTFPRELIGQADAVARKFNASLFHVLLAAVHMYFARNEERTGLVTALPLLNRPTDKERRVVGLFTSLLPLQLQAPVEASLVQRMQRNRDVLKRAKKHRLPMSQIFDLTRTGDEDRSLVDVSVNLIRQQHNYCFNGAKGSATPSEIDALFAPLSITVFDFDPKADVYSIVTFDQNLVAEEQVEAFTQSFPNLLRELVENPQRPWDSASVNSLVEWKPLTPAQENIWLDMRLRDDPEVYNLAFYVRFDGDFDKELFTRAVERVIAQNDALRIHTKEQGGRLLQSVSPQGAPMAYLDRSDEMLGDDDVHRHLQQMRKAPFAPGDALIRHELVKTGTHTYYWQLVISHLITDGWGLGILLNRVAQAYNALKSGSATSERPPQFLGYSEQNSALSLNSGRREYWESMFKKEHTRLCALPLSAKTSPTVVFETPFSRDVWNLAEQTAEKLQTSVFQILLSAVRAYFLLESDARDLIFATPLLNRGDARARDIVGLFTGVLPYRLGSTPDSTLATLVKEGAQGMSIAKKHRASYSAISSIAQEMRGAEEHLADLVVNYVRTTQVVEFSGLQSHTRHIGFQGAMSPLNVNIFDYNLTGDLILETAMQPHLISRKRVERFISLFPALFERLCESPHVPLHGLRQQWPGFESELRAGVVKDNLKNYPRETNVPSLFLENVKKYPERIAVTHRENSLTYAQLNSAAGRLANFIKQNCPENPPFVGLFMKRSLNLILCQVAIAKAGKACVNIDTDYPTERVKYMLEDSGAKLVFTDTETHKEFSGLGLDVQAFNMDETPYGESEEPAPDVSMNADSVLCAVYTSGTTGRPKGVLLPHKGIVRLVKSGDVFAIEPGDVVGQVCNSAFDAFLLEVWNALLNGGSLVVFDKDTILSPALFKAELQERGVDFMVFPTSLFKVCAAAMPEMFSSLKILAVGGEALDAHHAGLVMKHGRPKSFVNGYGPTENCVFSTFFEINSQEFDDAVVSIGRPNNNSCAVVLGPEMRPAVEGVEGELAVGGDGLALGYLNMPEETSARFIPNPIPELQSKRLYLTGDIVRLKDDGHLEYLGRKDTQVKFQGFRIELEEIERWLLDRSDVAHAVAHVWKEGGADVLAAYIVPAQGEKTPEAETLMETLEQNLPSFMIPSALVFLQKLPLTPNGKLDRRALPKPVIQDAKESAAPATATEQGVGRIYTELLGVERPGQRSDFFKLGGNSLKAAQFVARAAEVFNVEFPIRELFKKPTLKDVARLIDSLPKTSPLPLSMETPLRSADIPLAYAQERLWFLHSTAPDNPFYNMPFRFRLKGALNPGALRAAFQLLLERHEALRTTFTIKNGVPYQVIRVNPELPWMESDFRTAGDTEKKLKDVAMEDALKPFDLEHELPLRVHLVRMRDKEWALLVTIHHIAGDGWSIGVFAEDLSALYAIALGEKRPLSELPIQYADYALRQRERLHGERLERLFAYWKDALREAPTELELPTDFSRPETPSYRGGLHRFKVRGALTNRLRDLAVQTDTTLFMLLQAVFSLLISRFSGQKDVLIGAPYASRSELGVEKLVGFFVNTFALRSKIEDDPLFSEHLARTKTTVLGAFEHADMPIEKLVAELLPERKNDRMPLVQIMFALQNAPVSEYELPGVEMVQQAPETPIVRFDMEAHLWERGDELEGYIWYADELFTGGSIARLAKSFSALLEAVVDDPDRPVSALPLLSVDEQHALVQRFSHNERPYPRDAAVPELFHEWVRRTPDAPALRFSDDSLSYRELDEASEQLAGKLAALKGEGDFFVGVSMRRSARLAVAFLAILKAGGAYVPLDPEYPPERLRYMVEDSGVKAVLVDSDSEKILNAVELAAPIINMEEQGDDAQGEPAPHGEMRADDPAYVIYTSGTTGKPKGVVIPHRAIVRLVRNTDFVDIQPGEVVAQASNSSFDAYTFEMWGALLNGAFLVGIEKDTLLSPTELEEALRGSAVDYMFMTTALMNQCAQAAPSMFSELRMLCFGGEAVTPGAVRKILQAGGPERLLHVYGPTENTTFSTWNLVQNVDDDTRTIPIGGPLANSTAYVLDERRKLTPIGVPGELYVGGDGVALGYLNRPELTEERFVSDPFSKHPGARMYATGDVVRLLPDGAIEFMGRRDDQIKLRGHRIELGEIEAALSMHPAVAQAVAIVKKADREGEHDLLAAYVTPVDVHAGENAAALAQEFVAEWQELYAETYGGESSGDEDTDPTLNLAGWNSSYTGKEIPREEMQEWVDATVERIRALSPTRALEIGCGTGLLLSRIAPQCESYMGVDYSPEAVETVERLKTTRPELAHVIVEQRFADDFTGIEENSVDLVILNSIIQYFPDMGYLTRVLEGACRAVAPGGAIFVGDVRNLQTLSAFHREISVLKARDDAPRGRVRAMARRAELLDKELVVDPTFFAAFAEQVGDISHARVELKHGDFHNELTRHRYDATLFLGGADPAPDTEVQWRAWGEGVESEDDITRLLQSVSNAPQGVRGIPNLRLHRAVRMSRWLENADSVHDTVELFRGQAEPSPVSLDPQALFDRAAEQGVQVETRLREGCGETFDVIFHASCKSIVPFAPLPKRPWAFYGNNPLKGRLAQGLPPALQEHLAARLPEYMAPSSIIVLESLPLTPNGKLDKRALPEPDVKQAADREQPRTPTEELLVGLYADVLGLGGVGRESDFFALGGHSLMGTQLVSRVRDVFGLDAPIKGLFENPVLCDFAAHLDALASGGAAAVATPISRVPRKSGLPLSYSQEQLWLMDRIEPESWKSNMPFPYRLKGTLDRDALYGAFQDLFQRHEALRTSFVERLGRPELKIHRNPDVPWEEIDLRSTAFEEREEALLRVLSERARVPINLEYELPIRLILVRLDEDDWALLLLFHHIVADGWSVGVLAGELSTLYKGRLKQEEEQVFEPAPEIQYADYASWQRAHLAGELLEQRYAFWRKTLEGAPTVVEIPGDFPRPKKNVLRRRAYVF